MRSECYRGQNATAAPTCLARVNGVKICAQQNTERDQKLTQSIYNKSNKISNTIYCPGC